MEQTPLVYIQDQLTHSQLYLCLVDEAESFRTYIDKDVKAFLDRKTTREKNRKRWETAKKELSVCFINVQRLGTANQEAVAANKKAEAVMTTLRKEFEKNPIACPHTDVEPADFPNPNRQCRICGAHSYNNPEWN